MAAPAGYQTLDFTKGFVESLVGREFNQQERQRFIKALELLDTDERHRSLRVHELQRELEGIWSASASDNLRTTFLRRPNDRKLMLTCSHHHS